MSERTLRMLSLVKENLIIDNNKENKNKNKELEKADNEEKENLTNISVSENGPMQLERKDEEKENNYAGILDLSNAPIEFLNSIIDDNNETETKNEELQLMKAEIVSNILILESAPMKLKKKEEGKDNSTDILDLRDAPIEFLLVDNVIENNIDLDKLNSSVTLISKINQTEDEDCNPEYCLVSDSNLACDKDYPLNNLSCEEYNNVVIDISSINNLMNQRDMTLEFKATEPKQALVPYDFSSDEEDKNKTYDPTDKLKCFQDSNSDSEKEKQNAGNDSIDVDNERTRKRKLKPDRNEWVRNKNKRLRMKGKAYVGFTREKNGKIRQNSPRKERTLKEKCRSNKCKASKVRYCQEFSEVCRKENFKKFWNMSWDQRKVFVASHVFKTPTFKKTAEHSRRKGTYTYYLNDGNENLQVCRTMFTNTLDIGYKTVQSWVDGSTYGMAEETSTKMSTKDVVKKRYAESYKHLGEFFESLPKLPSHYCRRDTLKLYLEYSFQTMNQLYKVYVNNFCKEKDITPLGRNSFVKTFKEKNLALYTPKKDQCNTCFSFKYKNVAEEEYRLHIQRKENARQAKIYDKEEAEKGKLIVLSMDLQAVKLCPYLPANKIYFKTKLCCHNFTVYDLKSRDVMCYWFAEHQNNQLKASTFTSCIINYLEENCVSPSALPIVIYSDGCGYQNRNNVLANALLNFAVRFGITVFQKYLEPGHTQMECDSVHSVIERKLRHREIHLPSDYASVTIEARKSPKPYDVKCLEYTFFKEFSSSQHLRYTSIRPGRKASDPVINDIKCIKYNPNGTIEVKLDYKENYIPIPVRPKVMSPILNYPPMFLSKPKIKLEKWQHLQELKSVLPKDTHLFYDNILHA